MLKSRWWLALPVALIASLGSASAAQIRDSANLFNADTVRKARESLERIEREYRVPVVIETIDSLGDESIEDVSLRHAKQSGISGIFILISKQPPKIEVRDSGSFLGKERRLAIRQAFIDEFKNRDFDAGLMRGVSQIRNFLAEAGGKLQPPAARRGRAAAVPPAGARGVPQGRGGFSWAPLIAIGLVILGIILVIRVLGSLFGGAGRGYAGQARMGGPGPGPGPGGPYGAPGGYGYGGGGGGGFMSSLFGGIGGAMAGNWLYDRFSGRHHDTGGYADTTSPGVGDAGVPDTGGDWGGAGEAGDWGGGGDTGGGGGDWGGGGGDWGGGGDSGGGGGDW